jgi:hypothetical protein
MANKNYAIKAHHFRMCQIYLNNAKRTLQIAKTKIEGDDSDLAVLFEQIGHVSKELNKMVKDMRGQQCD